MDVCRSVLVSSWAREASADDPMIFNNDFLEFKNTHVTLLFIYLFGSFGHGHCL